MSSSVDGHDESMVEEFDDPNADYSILKDGRFRLFDGEPDPVD